MSFWWLAFKDTVELGRDKKALLTLVFMPILLIGILGAAFGNMFQEEEAQIQKFPLGIINMDEGELGLILEKEVFEKGLETTVRLESYDSEKELRRLLGEKQLTVGLILPASFSESVISGKETTVHIISVPEAQIQSSIVEIVIQQFSSTVGVETTGMKMAVEAAIKAGKPVSAEILSTPEFLSSNLPFTVLKETTVAPDQKQVGSFQYYAAGMGVMFLLMTVVIGVGAMLEEKEQEVYRRLLISNLTHSQYLLGKLLGLLFLSTIQLTVIILGTSLLFSVHWGESIAGVLLVGFAFVFSACGLGVLCGSLVKTEQAFNSAGILGTQLLAAAGGSMVPLYVFPDWLNELVKVFPNALALQTFLDLMSGESIQGVVFEAAILLLLGFFFIGLAFLRLSAERRKTYA
ncbi:ABC transporter permease [Mesobacillus maritimus]|uniref:ABC transporter permease n=1 Tax=Mesobacillus maritimus TaxID=1643336 RepID=UPI00384AB541